MIGKRLKQLRTERGLSQQALSEGLSVNKDSISQYERERVTPSDEVKIELAKYFNVSLDYLIGAIDTPRPLEIDGVKLPLEFKSDYLINLEVYANFLVYYYEVSNEEKNIISKWTKLPKGKREAFLKLIQED